MTVTPLVSQEDASARDPRLEVAGEALDAVEKGAARVPAGRLPGPPSFLRQSRWATICHIA